MSLIMVFMPVLLICLVIVGVVVAIKSAAKDSNSEGVVLQLTGRDCRRLEEYLSKAMDELEDPANDYKTVDIQYTATKRCNGQKFLLDFHITDNTIRK